jgi:beta-1,4-mannosyltransferase
MKKRESIYIYPNTKARLNKGSNDYIHNLLHCLSKSFEVINKEVTRFGLLDVLYKIRRIDIIYFNWIEELPDKRFAYFQIVILWLVLLTSKATNIKIVWFLHNNCTHHNKNIWLKKNVTKLMSKYSHYILSHSQDITFKVPNNKLYVFPHPIEEKSFISSKLPYVYDLLVWGKVSPYKGIGEFLEYNYNCEDLMKHSIVVAGKFESETYYNEILNYKKSNVTIVNKALEDDELTELMSNSKCVLFTYNSPSVLSSGALCKTLSYGKEIIGPMLGSFKELGEKKLIHNFKNYSEICSILEETGKEDINSYQLRLKDYTREVSWGHFSNFISKTLS